MPPFPCFTTPELIEYLCVALITSLSLAILIMLIYCFSTNKKSQSNREFKNTPQITQPNKNSSDIINISQNNVNVTIHNENNYYKNIDIETKPKILSIHIK